MIFATAHHNDPYAPPTYKCIIGNNIAFTKSTLFQLG